MLNAGLAKRYARALLNAVAKGEAVEKSSAELKMVLQTCAQSADLSLVLGSPVVPLPAKRRIIDELFSGKAEALTVNFLNLLLEKGRFNMLSEISAALDESIDEMRGRARVSVVSALSVTDDEKNYLRVRLEKWLKQDVDLDVKVDPSLLCGIQIRVGDSLFDGSGLGRLFQIRAALSAF